MYFSGHFQDISITLIKMLILFAIENILNDKNAFKMTLLNQQDYELVIFNFYVVYILNSFTAEGYCVQ